MNKGQQIAKTQQLAEDKIALVANEDKQAYASALVQEEDFQDKQIENQDKQ